VSIQAQVVNLLRDLQSRFALSYIFIAHDLAVVKSVSDRVIVMYLGRVCEVASPDSLYADPAHPYTEALLKSIPVPDPHLPISKSALAGELPSPIEPPSGCRFRTRCPNADALCETDTPVIREIAASHWVACHHPITKSNKS
jgi:peptide/nickel transport system ATP-binding protein